MNKPIGTARYQSETDQMDASFQNLNGTVKRQI